MFSKIPVAFSDPLVQNSRYKNGTPKARSFVFSMVPYTALQCDRLPAAMS
jgi:hypothetical protein